MDTIIIPDGDLVTFIERSALAGCTTLTSDDYGDVVVTRNWPSLSSGEEVLWRILDSFVDGDLADALARLDDRNLSAIVDVFTPVIARAAEARAYLETATA